MKVFYVRCSTEEQNETRQIDSANELGINKIFIDKLSGKNADRPSLKEMLEFVREGDIVYCSDISRIARNTKDLLNIVDKLKEKNVGFVSLKENIDTTTPQGKFMLTIFGAMAELERESILQRQREGIAVAKREGKYKGRQPIKLDEKRFAEAVEAWKNDKRTATSIMKEFNISSPTFYRKIKQEP